MKPGFALLLSDDSVALLHRTQAGWGHIGAIGFDHPELSDALAHLREQALDLEPEGFTTKVVIPNSQILYTTVPAGDDAAIHAALDGLTPYPLEDLVYDWVIEGDSAYVAALARETLDEAEGFANEHGFRPIGFAAIPPDGKFPREPWFGQTMTAPAHMPKGELADADPQPITVPEVEPEPYLPPAPPEVEPEPEPVVVPEPVVEPVVEPEPEVVPEPEPEPEIVPEPEPEILPEPVEDPVPPPRPEPVEQPVFDHPSFQRAKPTLAAPREQRSAPPERTTRDAPFVDLSRGPNAPTAAREDLTPPPLQIKTPLAAQRTTTKPAPVAPKREQASAPEPRKRPDPFAASMEPKGAPKFPGLILTIVLLLVLAGIAAWSSFYLTDLWRTEEEPVAVAALPVTEQPAEPITAELPPTAPEAAETVASAAPDVGPQDEIALTRVDAPMQADGDAAALTAGTADIRPEIPAAPPPFGTTYAYDDQGLIQPTEEGVITPGGVTLIAGAPPKLPPQRPDAAPEAAPAPQVDPALADARPRQRPDLPEPEQEAALPEGALETSPRPRERSEAVTAEVQRATDAASLVAQADVGSDLAVAISRRPEMRPSGVSGASVQAALAAAMAEPERPAQQATIRTAAAPAPAPIPAARVEVEADDEPEAAVVPRIPTRASVAQQATMVSALDLGRMNLIGISGASSNRAALIRQSNGRIARVKVGDRVDGGTVAAITENAVHYQKGGRMLALEMPRG